MNEDCVFSQYVLQMNYFIFFVFSVLLLIIALLVYDRVKSSNHEMTYHGFTSDSSSRRVHERHS